jgi:hypothetical protein
MMGGGLEMSVGGGGIGGVSLGFCCVGRSLVGGGRCSLFS